MTLVRQFWLCILLVVSFLILCSHVFELAGTRLGPEKALDISDPQISDLSVRIYIGIVLSS